MSKFEVGDRVKVVKGVEGYSDLTGVVDHQGEFGGSLYYFLELDIDGDGMPGFTPEQIELAPAPDERAAGDVLATDNLLRMGLEKADECLALQDKLDTAEHELAVSKYTLSAVEGAADYLSKQVVEAESELATLRQQLAAATERADALLSALRDANDQIVVHQGTLGILLSWLHKCDGYGVEDGMTEAFVTEMVQRDLDASKTNVSFLRTELRAAKAQADGKGE